MDKILRVFVVALAAGVLLVAGCAPTAAPTAAPTTQPTSGTTTPPQAPADVAVRWAFQTGFAVEDPWGDVGEAVVDRINTMANGRLVLELLPAGAVVPAGKEIDGIRTGAVQMVQTCNGYIQHLNSAGPLFDQMPGGLTNVQLKYWYTAGEGDQLGQEMVGPLGATWLANWLAAPEDFAYTTIPIQTTADIPKLKMRSAGMGAEVLSEMGASIVFLPGGELYESMQRGVINAFEYGSADNCWDMGFHEVIDYLYISPTRAPSDGGSLLAETKAFNALPADLKSIVMTASQSVRELYFDYAIMQAGAALERIRDYGVTVTTLPTEVEQAFLDASISFMDAKVAKESEFFGRVVESQRSFKALCELQGIQ